MVVVAVVRITVKPEQVDAFVQATLDNHRHSIRERGNVRFDVLRSPQEPSRFLLYEVYATQADADAHKQTTHYARWRDTVADMMAEPRVGVPYVAVAPADVRDW